MLEISHRIQQGEEVGVDTVMLHNTLNNRSVYKINNMLPVGQCDLYFTL